MLYWVQGLGVALQRLPDGLDKGREKIAQGGHGDGRNPSKPQHVQG